MVTLFRTIDGATFDDFKKAVQHERDLLDSKHRSLQYMKQKTLPSLHKKYMFALKALRAFHRSNERREWAQLNGKRVQTYEALGNLYHSLGVALSDLQKGSAEYRRLKIEIKVLSSH